MGKVSGAGTEKKDFIVIVVSIKKNGLKAETLVDLHWK